MSFCCLNCFNDKTLKKYINSQNNFGRCSYCNTRNIPTCDVKLLEEKFEFLMLVLKNEHNGKEAHQTIDEAFSIFSDLVRCKRTLLQDITFNKLNGQRFSLNLFSDHYKDGWIQLCDELKHTNRFFIKNEIYNNIFIQKSDDDFPILFSILEQLEENIITEDIFYRARVSDKILSASEMGAPPPHLATAGRANPKGISYAYLANNIDTCISEVRPYIGSDIYISKYNSTKNRRVIDLTEPRKMFSIIPFSESDYGEALAIIELLESFSYHLSIPVKPHLSDLDYIPTQFLCEYFKSLGSYDGIIFKSSFGKGNNYVFFDSKDFKMDEPIVYKLKDINFVLAE